MGIAQESYKEKSLLQDEPISPFINQDVITTSFFYKGFFYSLLKLNLKLNDVPIE